MGAMEGVKEGAVEGVQEVAVLRVLAFFKDIFFFASFFHRCPCDA